ncbi:hypothetical protein SLEP1_g23630 [Rubroshorea leprosula]|uniref:Peptidase A1 domain-containing protein n=1 Tax=Rubroshorea leprosula TaxID=152421 RepID=A0AAV5JJ82_9ROSI|nr:hypothetical protein SLEP1_g23630 [Rubroshorea leprosula]
MVASKPVIIKLTHRDSIHSPYYNPKESIIQRMENEIKTSADPFQALPPANDSIQFQIFPSDDKLFLANFSIGQPPIVQFAVMDTASGLLWIRCFPCSECSPQNVYPVYDRTKSSTYANLSCNSDYCKLSRYRWCNEDNSCGYKQGYVSGYSIGILATEQMMFLTSDEGIVFVPNVEVENQLQMLSLTKYDAVPDRGLLCYVGKLSQDLIGFPVVTFHFAGEAQLSLDINSLFYQRSRNVFCMLVRPSDVGGWRMSEMTIIGVNAQQNYNLAYDIPGKMLYFQRIDCQVLDP